MAAITVVVVVLFRVFKPSEVIAKSRDAQRFSDLKVMSEDINRYLAEGHDFKGLSGSYSSIDLKFTDDKARKQTDGAGWLPLNFTVLRTFDPADLPLDPLNTANHAYRFGAGANNTYEIDAVFESGENTSKMGSDGGNDPNAYEVGTDLTIL